ncbi:MAG: glycosyl transferase [Pseudomonadota bacterium]
MKKQIICINWGTKYGAPYINRLYAMVARNITPPFTFTCFTERVAGVRPEVRCFDLPPLPGPMPDVSKGQWRKSCLWGPTLGDLEGPVLFIDLDVVITGALDDFFAFGDPQDTVLAWNIARPLERMGQTSVYRFPVGKLQPLQALYASDPEGIAERYVFEQHFVTQNAPGGIRFWPRRWVRHFRIECIPLFPMNFFKPPRVPRDGRIVIFAGSLNPPDAIAGRIRADEQHLSPRAHFAKMWRRKARFADYRRYLLPAKFVEETWTE